MATSTTTTVSKTTTSTPAPKADPVSPAVEPTRARTIEEEGIGDRDPYPEGNPPTSQTTENSPMAPTHQNINTAHPDA